MGQNVGHIPEAAAADWGRSLYRGRLWDTSAFDGRLLLEAATWPEWLTLEHPDYEPFRWRALSHWYFHSDQFWLMRRVED